MSPRTPPHRSHAPREQGFSLVELAMVLLAVGLLAALFLPATNTMMDNKRRNETRAKLEALESAIARFVMTTKRLPCPADGAQGVANPTSGLEQRNAGPPATCTAMTTGVVPWRTLGVPVDSVIDAWGNLITYRVWARTNVGNGNTIETSLAMDRGMDMSECRPSSTGAEVSPFLCSPTSSVLNVLIANATPPPVAPVPVVAQSRGFRTCSSDSCPATTIAAVPGPNELSRRVDGNGVAYFLISHGANKYGAYNPTGTWVATANGPGPGAQENINRNNLALRTTSPDDFYIDADLSENTATYYDDIVRRPTVIKVALDAGLGPRP